MSSLLTGRAGVPRFAARARAGKPLTIVAYGTSMTLYGQYLARLPAALETATGNARIRLIKRGLRGFGTFTAAFRTAQEVLPYAPDLVLIEFAHNDAAPDAIDMIPPALDGIIGQVRAANPLCEFAFVYLAPAGVAAGGPSAAMRVYEEIAGYYRFPSFDLATLSEQLVAGGRAAWTGAGEGVLTSDGFHHTAAASELLGAPFATAFVELLRDSDRPPPDPRPVLDRSLLQTARTAVADHRVSGPWTTGVPARHETRNCEAYDGEAAEPLAPGAAFRLRFEGTRAFVWAMGTGALEIVVAGLPARHRIDVRSSSGWTLHTITPTLPLGTYDVEGVALELPLLLGDLFVIGRLLADSEAPDMVK